MINRRKAIGLIVVLLALLVGAQPALAHANLVRSDPPANSAQKTAPTVVRLWYSEEVEPSFSQVRVLDSRGAQLDNGDSHRAPNDSKEMDVSLPPDLPLGLYTVVWNALSAVDGHATTGSFAFTVGDVPLSESSSREIIALVDTTLANNAPPPAYQVVARAFNLLALVALAGSFFFPLLVLFSAIQSAQTQKPIVPTKILDSARAAWSQRWLRVVIVAWVLYAIATLGMLVMQSLTVGGLQAIPRVLTATRFGTLWSLRVAILLALGALIVKARSGWTTDIKPARTLLLAAGLSVLLILTQSLNSHNAALDDPPLLALVIDFVHTAGTAIWLGGLLQLLTTLPIFIRALDANQQGRVLGIVIARFSFIAFLVVGIIVASGAYSMLVQVGSIEALFGTLYGDSLLIKLALVGVLLAVAAFNLIVVRPALAQATSQRGLRIARAFRRATVVEVVTATAIIVLVGLMTSVAPARAAYESTPKLLLQTQRVDDLQVTLGVAPGTVGTNDFDVKVQEAANGTTVSNAQVVRLLGTMQEMDMGTQETTLTQQGAGHYTLRGDLLSMVGRWKVEVLIRRDGLDDARTTFNFAALSQSPKAEPSYLSLALHQPEVLLGLALTALAFAVGTASVMVGKLKTRERRVTLLGAIGVAVLGLIVVWQNPLVVSSSSNTVTAASLFVPEQFRFLRSPMPGNADTLNAGRQIYAQNCVACHGPQGKGNGPLAVNLNPRPVDLTVHARLHTEGELHYWVTNGIKGSAMSAWQEQLTDTQRWQVVQFIRSLSLGAQTPAAPTNAPTPAP